MSMFRWTSTFLLVTVLLAGSATAQNSRPELLQKTDSFAWDAARGDGSAALLSRVGNSLVIPVQGRMHVQLRHHKLDLQPGMAYLLKFFASSDKPCDLRVIVASQDDSARHLDVQPLAVPEKWTSYEFMFVAGSDELPAVLVLDAPSASGDLRFRSLSLRAAPVARRHPIVMDGTEAAKWKHHQEGSARGSHSQTDDGILVRVDSAAEGLWTAAIYQEIELKAGRRYRVDFFARSDQPREVQVGIVYKESGKWPDVAPKMRFTLDTNWRRYRQEFTADAIAQGRRLFLELNHGGQAGSFLISDFVLEALPQE